MDLVPNIVDRRARTEPETIYAEYPISPLSYANGYRKISIADLANAINGVAWWLCNTLGQGKDFETLAYIGPNDLRYPALILGAVKAGYTMFLTSPRNSVAAQINLFDILKCKIILSPDPRPAPLTAILAAYEMRVLEVPSVDDLLNISHPHFPFGKVYTQALKEPLFIIHTSGSTGFPKHLIYTHATAARNMKMISLKPPPGCESQDKLFQGNRVFMTFPPFHGASIVTLLFNAVPFGTVIIAPTSGAIPSAEGLVEGLKKAPANVAFIVPSIVQELSQNPDLLDCCSTNLEVIIYCGGDLPKPIGDIIASKIRLYNQFGASELGLTANILSLRHRGPEDWKYVQFHPELGVELRHTAEDLHELYVVRDPRKEEQQPTFTLFPELHEYASRDLFVRHPSKQKSDLWSWRARADDIIVFLNGEKTNPISMEQHILASNSDISALLVLGAQRFQPALLIEPVTEGQELTPAQRAAFIERIWPTIEEANRDAPSHAQIVKSHMLFAHPQKPMIRAGKGTIQRSGTLNMYAKEIDALYTDADTMTMANGDDVTRLHGDLNNDTVTDFIREMISSITGWKELADSDDLFALGMDSLNALMAVRKIRQGLGLPTFALSTLYTNPSISALTSAVFRLTQNQNLSETARQKGGLQTRSDLLRVYRGKIDHIAVASKHDLKEAASEVVVLTGSTGTLGSYILDSLLANPAVAHVYCLNRKHDSSSAQTAKNQVLGLPNGLDRTRVTFLTSDLTKPNLGLDEKTFGQMQSSATVVIHNAWPVNFNLSLPSFSLQFDGVVNLIEFVAGAATAPRLLFVSSISSVMSYRSPSLKIPEQAIHSDSAPGPNGYAESKYLTELLLEYAAQKLNISTSVVRVGQIAGAANHAGLWNRNEWFPSLVISSLHVGAIPDTLGPRFDKVDWIPVDLLAEILVELAPKSNQSHETQPLILHAVNPHPISWKETRELVLKELSSHTKQPLEIVSVESWLRRVREDIETAAGNANATKEGELEAALQQNPAARLLNFYAGILGSKEPPGGEFELRETLKRSAKLQTLEGVKAEWISKWVRELIGAS